LTPDQIRLTTIEALFSDPSVANLIVLKGGNALNLIHGIGGRSSLDIDLSLPSDFEDLAEIGTRIQTALEHTFARKGFSVFDSRIAEKPSRPLPNQRSEWGGYEVVFKVIHSSSAGAGIDTRRREAAVVGPLQERVIKVQFSKYEFCGETTSVEVGDSQVTVYTPALIAVEKLRAICQQMREYLHNRTPSPRARDFYDIHSISAGSSVDLTSPESVELLRRCFRAKEVDGALISKIDRYREFHRQDWPSVEDAVATGLLDFDFYFDYVLTIARQLESLVE